eukprot:TRINITY_DN32263_c0_g1_i1.p1 TRINITY_DN32263_c0_g1~~TRINITY_DN32263_c0_g1_i1.p1  ORF type:complete len:1083 (+),score=363.86 TRINITY_DN32263_c0_g1_i1:62-3250(+)
MPDPPTNDYDQAGCTSVGSASGQWSGSGGVAPMRERMSQWQQELEEQRARINDLERERDAQKGTEGRLRAMLAKSEHDVEYLQCQVQQLQEKNAKDMELLKGCYAAEGDAAEEARKRALDLGTESTKLQAELAEEQRKVEMLRTRTLKREEKLRADLAAARAAADASAREAGDAKADAQEAHRLEKLAADALQGYEERRERAEGEIAALKSALVDAGNEQVAARRAGREELAEARGAEQEARRAADRSAIAEAELHTRVQELESAATTAAEALEQAAAETRAARESAAAEATRVRDAEAARDDTRAQLQRAEERLSAASVAADSLRHELTDVCARAADAECAAEVLKKQVNRYERLYEQAVSEAEEQTKAAGAELQQLRTKVARDQATSDVRLEDAERCRHDLLSRLAAAEGAAVGANADAQKASRAADDERSRRFEAEALLREKDAEGRVLRREKEEAAAEARAAVATAAEAEARAERAGAAASDARDGEERARAEALAAAQAAADASAAASAAREEADRAAAEAAAHRQDLDRGTAEHSRRLAAASARADGAEAAGISLTEELQRHLVLSAEEAAAVRLEHGLSCAVADSKAKCSASTIVLLEAKAAALARELAGCTEELLDVKGDAASLLRSRERHCEAEQEQAAGVLEEQEAAARWRAAYTSVSTAVVLYAHWHCAGMARATAHESELRRRFRRLPAATAALGFGEAAGRAYIRDSEASLRRRVAAWGGMGKAHLLHAQLQRFQSAEPQTRRAIGQREEEEWRSRVRSPFLRGLVDVRVALQRRRRYHAYLGLEVSDGAVDSDGRRLFPPDCPRDIANAPIGSRGVLLRRVVQGGPVDALIKKGGTKTLPRQYDLILSVRSMDPRWQRVRKTSTPDEFSMAVADLSPDYAVSITFVASTSRPRITARKEYAFVFHPTKRAFDGTQDFGPARRTVVQHGAARCSPPSPAIPPPSEAVLPFIPPLGFGSGSSGVEFLDSHGDIAKGGPSAVSPVQLGRSGKGQLDESVSAWSESAESAPAHRRAPAKRRMRSAPPSRGHIPPPPGPAPILNEILSCGLVS